MELTANNRAKMEEGSQQTSAGYNDPLNGRGLVGLRNAEPLNPYCLLVISPQRNLLEI